MAALAGMPQMQQDVCHVQLAGMREDGPVLAHASGNHVSSATTALSCIIRNSWPPALLPV